MSAAEKLQPTLAEAIAAHGLNPPERIEPGRFHRFPGAGKGASNRAGWCLLFDDGDGGAFGDWSTGLNETWQARQPASEAERKQWAEEIRKARETAEQQRKQAQDEAATSADEIWNRAQPADSLHGYLVTKDIQPHGIRQDGDRLLVPLISPDGEIRSVQRIDTEGSKRFHPGGEVTGNHYMIGDPADTIVIAEGFATAASIFEATGHAVAVAFNAGNLEPVAKAIRGRHTEARLIVAADDDRNTDGNPGISKAREAAKAVSGEMVTPGQAGDFNDLKTDQGAEAVRQRFEQPESSPPGFSLVPAGSLKPRPMDWLISDLFERDSLLQIFGPPGGAKTFTVLDMACCIASGKEYHGKGVRTGPVVYIAGEGFNGLARRLKAWQIVNGISLDDKPLYVSTMPASLLDPVNVSAVMAAIDQTECKPVMVVLDTVARNFGPGDENSTQDMTQFVTACDQIRSAYGCTLALIHHTGHQEQARGRGSSVLNGAIDASYRITREQDGPVLIENTKMKDAIPPEPFAFKFETVELGFDNEDGTQATSAVLARCPVPTKAPRLKGKHQARAAEILQRLIDENRTEIEREGMDPKQARANRDDWRQACIDDGMPASRFHEAEKALKQKSIIHQEFAWVRLVRS